MTDFERTTTLSVTPDVAFGFLSDPGRLPTYLPAVALVEAIAVDGDPAAQDDDSAVASGDPIDQTHFLPDAGARRVEWGHPRTGYAGSFEIAEGPLRSISRLTIRLHIEGDPDRTAIEGMLDQAIAGIRRELLRS